MTDKSQCSTYRLCVCLQAWWLCSWLRE